MPLVGEPPAFKVDNPFAVAATDVAILIPALSLFAAISAALKANPPGIAAYFAMAAAFAACVFIMVLATPTAFSAINAAACILLLSPAKSLTKLSPDSKLANCASCIAFSVSATVLALSIFF